MTSTTGAAMRATRRGFTLIELLVVIAIIGVLIGLMLAAVQKVRASASRAECQNTIRQLGIAAHDYHNVRSTFPPGNENSQSPLRAGRTWHVHLLPFLEQAPRAGRVDEAYRADPNPFHAPPHTELGQPVGVFRCSADSRVAQAAEIAHTDRTIRVALSSYLGVSGRDRIVRNGVLFMGSRTRSAEILDGLSNTLLIGERPPSADLWFGWWYTGMGTEGDGSLDSILGVAEVSSINPRVSMCGVGRSYFRDGSFREQCAAYHYWSPHPGGANFAFADGSVRFLTYSAEPVMVALSTRAGGESVSIPE
jgi:prepilin-type N-terminal cleavage/methylation domain-containing protein/prepilin-type processing-associated H-X9-DG protein